MFVGLIRFYQVNVRPHLLGSCKFCPTCSQYVIEALLAHGLVRGSVLGARRVVRCHPFSPGGIDPVPSPDHDPQGKRSRPAFRAGRIKTGG